MNSFFQASIIFFSPDLDGTSPSPLLFASATGAANDVGSRHQQIIDAFLDDGL